LLDLLFDAEDGDSMFLRNVSGLLPDYINPTTYLIGSQPNFAMDLLATLACSALPDAVVDFTSVTVCDM
jgi:hypothetical protein